MFSTILILVFAFLSLIVLMIIHEFGHFIIAKKFGVRVDEFGIGYPPRIFGKKIGETIYSINWFQKFIAKSNRCLGKFHAMQNIRIGCNFPNWYNFFSCFFGYSKKKYNRRFLNRSNLFDFLRWHL